MGSVRPWHYILFGLAVVALGVGLWMSMRGGVDLADELIMVDVKTGDRFRFDVSGNLGVTVPAKHPETGERTLLPVVQADGKWYIGDRYRGALGELEASPDAVSSSTYEVTFSSASVRAGRTKK